MSKKITAAIIEDEDIELLLLKKLLEKYKDIEIVGSAGKIETATNLIIDKNPDVIFLDVQLFGNHAFEILDQLEEFNISPYIIFTTAHREYAIEAIRHDAIDFLLKPIDKQELDTSIKRLRDKISGNHTIKNIKEQFVSSFRKCIISSYSRTYFVDYEDIVYLETVKGQSCTYIYTTTNDSVIEATKGLGEFEDELVNQGFMRPSRFYIINPAQIKTVHQNGKIEFIKGEIKISSRKIKNLIDILHGKD